MDTFRRIGDPRRRLPDRAVFVAVAIIAFIGVALLKPWGTGPVPAPTEIPTLGPTPSSAPLAPSAEPDPSGPVPVAVDRRDPLRWEVAAPHLSSPDAWGVRALVTRPDPATATLTELIVARRPVITGPVSTTAPPDRAVPEVVLRTDGMDVAALGVTTPSVEAVLDVRIWRLGGGIPTPVAMRDLLGEPLVMDPLFLPPIEAPGDVWAPGSYRLDVLVGEGIRRIEVVIPGGDAAPTPGNAASPDLDDEGILRAVQDLPPGAFALGSIGTAQGDVAGIDPAPGVALDEVAAWLDIERGGPRPGADQDPPPLVRPSTIGVLLPAEGPFETARLTRLAPWSQDLGEATFRGQGPAGQGVAAFRAARGWPAGTYRIDATWSDDAGRHEGSWHLDLYPPRGRGPSPGLSAARFMALSAGTWQIVDFNGWDEPLTPYSRVRRRADAPLPEAIGRGCAGVPLLEAGPVVGIAHPGGRLTGLGLFRRSIEGGLRPFGFALATGAVPGLEIVRSHEGATWRPGVYLATMTRKDVTSHLTFCLGARDALSFLMAVPLADE